MLITLLFVSLLCSAEPVSFDKDIRPLFQEYCYKCHYTGYWEWTKYENAFKYKDKIRQRVWENRTMPMGGVLSEDERARVRDWVDQGAKP